MESTNRSSSSSNDANATSLQQSQPTLCSNRCGFFGTADKKGLCSKCFNDSIIKNRQAARANADVVMPHSTLRPLRIIKRTYKDARRLADGEAEEKREVDETRCGKCNKKVGLIGFECRCGTTFCRAHRYAEEHGCGFDFKGDRLERF